MGNFAVAPSCCTDRLAGSQGLLQTSQSIGPAGRPHHRRFEQARLDKNVGTLVTLVSSDEPLPKQSRVTTHPWAKPPESLGPLVAAHIAVMLSGDRSGTLAEDFVQHGLTEALTTMLKSSQADKVHAAAVTLLFLSEKSVTACDKLCQSQWFDTLEICYLSGTIGLQLTALSTLKNIARHNPSRLPLPILHAAATQQVDILKMQSVKRTPKANDFLLEDLQTLTDMMEVFRSLPESEYRQVLIDKAIPGILVNVVLSDDRDVADEARRLQAMMSL